MIWIHQLKTITCLKKPKLVNDWPSIEYLTWYFIHSNLFQIVRSVTDYRYVRSVLERLLCRFRWWRTRKFHQRETLELRKIGFQTDTLKLFYDCPTKTQSVTDWLRALSSWYQFENQPKWRTKKSFYCYCCRRKCDPKKNFFCKWIRFCHPGSWQDHRSQHRWTSFFKHWSSHPRTVGKSSWTTSSLLTTLIKLPVYY